MEQFPILTPTLQLGFYQRLIEANKTFLLPALLEEVKSLNIGKLDEELLNFAGNERLAFIARLGLRGELVFPVPYVLQSKPMLLGYYRLLLGFSQKEFYRNVFSRFKKLEEHNSITETTARYLDKLCISLIGSSWILVNGIPDLSQEIIKSLTLLTLGPQLRGSRNVNLGAEADRTIFALIKSIIANAITAEGDTFFEVMNNMGRIYRIEFSPDPDIAIRQVLQDGTIRNRTAIEVKGGRDFANIHNRLGEAEKSHQKAKGEGFTQFWTIVNVSSIDDRVWRKETPTTNEIFYLEQIANINSVGYHRFREYLVTELGM